MIDVLIMSRHYCMAVHNIRKTLDLKLYIIAIFLLDNYLNYINMFYGLSLEVYNILY